MLTDHRTKTEDFKEIQVGHGKLHNICSDSFKNRDHQSQAVRYQISFPKQRSNGINAWISFTKIQTTTDQNLQFVIVCRTGKLDGRQLWRPRSRITIIEMAVVKYVEYHNQFVCNTSVAY